MIKIKPLNQPLDDATTITVQHMKGSREFGIEVSKSWTISPGAEKLQLVTASSIRYMIMIFADVCHTHSLSFTYIYIHIYI